jgi:heme A synthase
VNGYVAGGWGATVAILVLYAWRTIHRGRVLSRSLPEEDRTWR